MLPFVFGAGKLDRCADAFDRFTNAILLGHLLGKPTGPLLAISVHIDDVAKSHVAALEPSVPAGKYLLDSEEIIWSVARTVVKEHSLDQIGNLFPTKVETKIIKLHLDGYKAETLWSPLQRLRRAGQGKTMECYLGLLPK